SSPLPRFAKAWDAQAHLAPPAAASAAPVNRFHDMPIAIVGMSGVMPQSDDLDEFWQHLKNGDDLISVIPEDRWDWREYYGDPFKEVNKSNSKWGGFMKEVDKFDALFFGISRREAQMMDPQQRIFLETVWKAIEDSGHRVSDLSGTRTGLFVGVATNDYVDVMNRLNIGLDGYSASGNSHSVLANRVSFLLNLRGPSAPIDTACSSSLVALHRAIESIHTGSCDMAIVGGVQVMLSPAAYISFGMAGMLSGDGKCKTFDKRANGYVRGEGAGAILLKPLAQAEADGDHIYAVVRATAENHGGRVTTLTAPNSAAQAELLIEAYDKARMDPATVGYIECHGTGTGLGDPIEIQALSKAFGELYKRHEHAPAAAPHIGLSSAKTNIGHLETAAGIAGILRVLLAIRHRQIPANVHFEELNPYINLAGSPFYIADRTRDWEPARAGDGSVLPRRAGVSSFGFGGANAHIVLEEHPASAMPAPAVEAGPQLFVLSAKTDDRLRAYAAAMLERAERAAPDLIDFAYTLQVGRDEMPERLAVVAASHDELCRTLRAFLDGAAPDGAAAAGFSQGSSRPRKDAAPASADTVQALIEAQDLAALGAVWVNGAEVDWKCLRRPRTPRRLALPTYPFARERCWIPGVEGFRRSGDAAAAMPAPAAAAAAAAAPSVVA
ncbi:type I polyketide synthase, partial [Tahibacter caeni]|uniref:type I polyketide synthase n=1 Tax=Tahibacter caeni TaxID=1453545 RepID=UPI0021480B06